MKSVEQQGETVVVKGKNIVLGITGGIAAYKVVDVASKLTQEGFQVDVIMTDSAVKFVSPLTFQSITQRPVATDMFRLLEEMHIGHVSLAQRADLIVIAPASANTIAKLACGISDNMLTTTVLATRAPVLLAPAMDGNMYANPITQANVARLKQMGMRFVGPAYGRLASGLVGLGRLAEPPEILKAIHEILEARQDLAGKKVVVTAGGTQEPIDPVRFVGNHSSGKMGYALAEAARERGASVVLVSAPSALAAPAEVETVRVQTARQMQAAVRSALAGADVLLMAAAVADYRPEDTAGQKIKKTGAALTLRLVPNPDILAEVGEDPAFARVLKVGFAAETENLLQNAADKLRRKRLDLLVGNDVSSPDSGFGADTNRVVLLAPGAEPLHLPTMSKREVADRILDRVVGILGRR